MSRLAASIAPVAAAADRGRPQRLGSATAHVQATGRHDASTADPGIESARGSTPVGAGATPGCGSVSRRACASGLLAACFGSRVLAQPVPPAPGVPRLPMAATLREQTLANGLHVVVAQRRAVPLASARLVVLSGSDTDPPRHAGRAAMTAALLSRGTRQQSAPALAAAAEALGSSLASEGGRDQSSIGMTVASPMLDAALALIAEVVAQPTFRQSELVRLRSQLLDELALAYASPATLAALGAERLLFGASPYGRAVEGTPTSLPRIARGELLALHAAHYRPRNAVLVLAGDVDFDAALASAARHFAHWTGASGGPVARARDDAPGATDPATTAGSSRDGRSSSAKAALDTATLATIDMGARGQAAIVLGMRLPPRETASERTAAIAAVVNGVLGADYSSRLNQAIRIRRGLSYGAGSSVSLRRRGGVLLASVQTRNETAAEVVALMQREIDRLAETPVDADELAARKAALIGRFTRSVETTDGLSAQLAARLALGVPAAALADYPAALAAVGVDDVQRYAVTHFGRAGRRVVVCGEAGRFAAALEAVEPRSVRIGVRQLDLD